MNNKGFTLIELLAVIVILGIIATIGTVSVATIKNKMNYKMTADKVELALGGVSDWGRDNIEQLKANPSLGTNTLATYMSRGYIKTDEVNASNNPDILHAVTGTSLGTLSVRAYIENRRVYSCVVNSTANKNLLTNDVWTILQNEKVICP